MTLISKKGSIYLVESLRAEGIDYANGLWHWSQRLGGYYTHSLSEAKLAGWVGNIYSPYELGGDPPE